MQLPLVKTSLCVLHCSSKLRIFAFHFIMQAFGGLLLEGNAEIVQIGILKFCFDFSVFKDFRSFFTETKL